MNWYKIARRNEYQIVANKLTKYILERFKKNGINEEKYDLGVPELKKILGEAVDENFLWDNLSAVIVNFDTKELHEQYINIGGSMNNFGIMGIKIIINPKISNNNLKSFFEKFYYELYETINHELEHARQQAIARKNNMDFGDYYKYERPETLEEYLNNLKNYLLQQSELEAFSVSVYRKAISQKRDPIEVIKEYIYETLPSPNFVEKLLRKKGELDKYQQMQQVIDSIASEFIAKASTYLVNRFPNFEVQNELV